MKPLLLLYNLKTVRDHPYITTTKLVAHRLGNPSVSVPRNREPTRPGSLAHVIHGWSFWRSNWWTNENRDDVIDNQWNRRISRILSMIPNWIIIQRISTHKKHHRFDTWSFPAEKYRTQYGSISKAKATNLLPIICCYMKMLLLHLKRNEENWLFYKEQTKITHRGN